MGLELPKRARKVALGAVTGSAFLVLSGCSAQGKNQIERLAMPTPSTKEAQHIYDLWQWAWLAAILTGILVWGLILYVVVRYRRRDESAIPVQTRYNLPMEIFYTIAPIMMVIVLFYFTVAAQEDVLHAPKDLAAANAQADQTVTVVGQQWSWTFNYTDVSTLGGATVYEGGTTAARPTLWLVKDKSVSVDLYSPDVIHSFWVPAFLFKMDVVPGREKDNHFTFTPDREGIFKGRCAELCGVYHSRMLFNVKVDRPGLLRRPHEASSRPQGTLAWCSAGQHVNEQPGLEENASNGGQQ